MGTSQLPDSGGDSRNLRKKKKRNFLKGKNKRRDSGAPTSLIITFGSVRFGCIFYFFFFKPSFRPGFRAHAHAPRRVFREG